MGFEGRPKTGETLHLNLFQMSSGAAAAAGIRALGRSVHGAFRLVCDDMINVQE